LRWSETTIATSEHAECLGKDLGPITAPMAVDRCSPGRSGSGSIHQRTAEYVAMFDERDRRKLSTSAEAAHGVKHVFTKEQRTRRAAVRCLVGVLVLAGCGSSASKSGGTDSTTTEASSSTAVTKGDSAFVALLVKSGATKDELTCVRAAPQLLAALDCLSLDTLVSSQERYLRDETKATEEQVACVSKKLRAMTVEQVRALANTGIGEAVYVPCGLPD